MSVFFTILRYSRNKFKTVEHSPWKSHSNSFNFSQETLQLCSNIHQPGLKITIVSILRRRHSSQEYIFTFEHYVSFRGLKSKVSKVTLTDLNFQPIRSFGAVTHRLRVCFSLRMWNKMATVTPILISEQCTREIMARSPCVRWIRLKCILSQIVSTVG